MPEPLTDAYLQQCEWDARKFQGCWDQGTSGVLAAHVMRLLAELRELRRHRCRWGDDPSGPYVADEYIKSL